MATPEVTKKYKNKVEYAGESLIDLTADTVTAGTLKSGVTAHDASGATITGTLTIPTQQTKNVDLAMSSGNQVVKPDSGKVLSQVTVMKPTTMLPENIKKDVNIGGVVGTMEGATETWVWNEYIYPNDDISSPVTWIIPFKSNDVEYSSLGINGDWLSGEKWGLVYGHDMVSMGGNVRDMVSPPAYRKITFLESPTGNLLTYLKANATKQPSDAALQPSKSVTITENGTTAITPDTPYDGIQSVEVTTNTPEPFPNGTTWTCSNIKSVGFYEVCNANGLWVAGSNGNGLYYSTDGKTWTKSNITRGRFTRVYNAYGIWIAYSIGSSGSSGGGASAIAGLYYSSDGKTWTQSNITSKSVGSITKSQGAIFASDTNLGVLKTNDGKTWSYTSAITLKNICAFKDVLIGTYSDYGIWFSLNGSDWTQGNITGKQFNIIYAFDDLCVARGFDIGLYYSTDGKTWTQSNITSGYFNDICKADGLWVAGSNNNGLYYSTDGKTWTQSNITSGSFISIYNANGIWVAGSNGNGLYYSTDGKTWTKSNITSGTFYAVYKADGLWVAGSNNNGLYYSVSWEPS